RQTLYAVGENGDLVNHAGTRFANDFLRRVGVGQKVGHVGVLALLRPADDRVTIRPVAARLDDRAVADLEIDRAVIPDDRSKQCAGEVLYSGALGARPADRCPAKFADPIRDEIIRQQSARIAALDVGLDLINEQITSQPGAELSQRRAARAV